MALHPHSCSSQELFLTFLLPSAPQPFAEAEKEQLGEVGIKTYQSEGPVGHTSDNISVAGMRVELRGLQGWRRTLLHWCGCGIHATGLDAMRTDREEERAQRPSPWTAQPAVWGSRRGHLGRQPSVGGKLGALGILDGRRKGGLRGRLLSVGFDCLSCRRPG